MERLTDFLLQSDARAAGGTTGLQIEAISILENHPLIGRPVEYDLRELVISRGKSSYLALCDHEPSQETVRILAIRHQREAGYAQQWHGEALASGQSNVK